MPTRIMLVAVLILIWPAFPVLASMQTVHAVGEHRMGDFETKQEAIRLATEAAKRDALEQAVIYLESLTVVKDLTIVKEEIRSYTAGVIKVIDKQVATRFDGGSLVIQVIMTAQLDPEEVAQAVAEERQKNRNRPTPLASRRWQDFTHSPLYKRVSRFAGRELTAKELEAAEFHHRGEDNWYGATQEDIEDIKRLKELERRFAFDAESFYNSPACARTLLTDTCIEELQDAGVPHQEILRQDRLRFEAWTEQQRKLAEIKAAEYHEAVQKKAAAEEAEEEARVKEAAQRAALREEKDAAEEKRRRMIDDLAKDIIAERFVPDTPRQARGLAELLATPQSPNSLATWIVLDREGDHDPATWIGKHGAEAQECSPRPVLDECISILIHADFSANEVGEWIVAEAKNALPPANVQKGRDLATRREEAKRAGYSDAEISSYLKDHMLQAPMGKRNCDTRPVSDRCIKDFLEAGLSEREVGAWIVKNSRKILTTK